jgi:Zn-dependent protease
MGRTLSFRLGPFPVRVDLTFFVVIAFLGWANSRSVAEIVAWTAIGFASVLLHELGHAVAMRAFDREPQILLYGMGGLTTGGAVSAGRSVIVSLAGPFTGIAVGLVVLAVAGVPHDIDTLGHAIVFDALWINLGWAVFNLLPILPLDGGNVLTGVLDLLTGGRGRRAANVVSLVVAGLGGVVALAAHQPFLLLLVLFLGMSNVSELSRAKQDQSVSRLREGRRALLVKDLAGAHQAAVDVLADRRSPVAGRKAAVELLAWTALAARRPEDAQQVLAQLPPQLQADALLRGALELITGHREALDLLVPALAHTSDASGLAVAAGIVSERGLTEEVVRRIELLPPDQRERAAAAFRAGLDYRPAS